MRQYKLGDIVTIVKGVARQPTHYFVSEGIPFVSCDYWDLLKNNLQLLPKIPSSLQHESDLTKVPTGAVLIYPSKNAYYVCQQEYYIGENIMAMIPCQSIILSKYLFYYLQAQSLKIEKAIEQKIYLPRISIQQQLIAHMAQVHAVSDQVQNILIALLQLEAYLQTENTDLLKIQDELIEKMEWMNSLHKILLHNIKHLK
ncbi:hypothetical protein [Metasolibacillus sp.]|uniref:hypothetical protein n=1 Tax=Metasolibacillus sp. TaxID=2703680 RepID=UPI0025D82D87|nr:hypothetical protein [Metasolibacillus sp.]MCT6923901.1 hypothetical protein [Metasolibacillus sp.]MCT6940439.1 hypothetical protein [Metasolibacillus sp.]